MIAITAQGSAASFTSYAVSGGTVKGGSGTDEITLNASGGGFGRVTAIAAFNADINAGNDDDRIELIASGSSQTVTAAGAQGSTIKGGNGNDTISFRISGNALNGRESAAIISSEVYGNGGNDTITATVEAGSSGSSSFADYDIVDALVFGGSGDDTFDVGIGNGTLQGNSGTDTAILDYFNNDTMDVTAIAGGVRITGSQTRNGTEGTWSQDIVSTENYQVNGVLYTAESLVSTFA